MNLTGSKEKGVSPMNDDMKIAYAPKVLRSMREICEVMGVGAKTVRRWSAAGAPIAVEGEGSKTRYSVEVMQLQAWRVTQARNGGR